MHRIQGSFERVDGVSKGGCQDQPMLFLFRFKMIFGLGSFYYGPNKEVASNYWRLAVNYGLLWGMVAQHFELVGFPGNMFFGLGCLLWDPTRNYVGSSRWGWDYPLKLMWIVLGPDQGWSYVYRADCGKSF